MNNNKIFFTDSICSSIKKSKSFNRLRLKAIARKAIFNGCDCDSVLSSLKEDSYIQKFTSVYGSERAKYFINEIINEALVEELI